MIRRNEFGQPIGSELAGWIVRPVPTRSPMVGRLVRLEPVDVAKHGDGLFRAFAAAPDGRDWTYMPSGPFSDAASFLQHLEAQSKTEDPFHHAIVSQDEGAPLGTAAFMRIDPPNGVIEIGHIAFSPAIQRTAGATEAIFLMLCRAFDELGYRRLEWKCDALNLRSRRAAERLGFSFEGIFRQAMVTRGRNRDTAWYAIVDEDWAAIKARILAWLSHDNFDETGKQLRPLTHP